MNQMVSTQGSDYIFKTPAELLQAAELTSAGAEKSYCHAAYLYFIARFMVAVYEARMGRLPIQVWNEYRNALDHFMRFVTNPVDENTAQLSRMEGHIQRAVLDICKFFCHAMEERMVELTKRCTFPAPNR